jgi:hypothetical protein
MGHQAAARTGASRILAAKIHSCSVLKIIPNELAWSRVFMF